VMQSDELLQEIWDWLGEKKDGACPVCQTYTHKVWCWYPHLCEILGKPLDEYDKKHHELIKTVEAKMDAKE